MAFFDVNPLRSMSRRALGAFVICAALTGCGGGGGGDPVAPVVMTPDPMTPTPLTFTATAGADTFAITTDITDPAQSPLESVIDGLEGQDELQLNAGAVVAGVSFSDQAPTQGAVHLRSVERITINGGTVNGAIDAGGATTAITFNLTSGTITGAVTGTSMADTFNLEGGTISGTITGGGGDDFFVIRADIVGDAPALNIVNRAFDGGANTDTLLLPGGSVVNNINIATLDSEGALVPPTVVGDVHLLNFESITLFGGTVNGNISNGDMPTTYTVAGLVRGTITGGAMDDTFNLVAGAVFGAITGDAGADTFTIAGDIVTDTDADMAGAQTALTISQALDGGAGVDTFWLNAGGVVHNIANTAGAGDVDLVGFETIIINGGTVNMNVTNGDSPTLYVMRSGTVTNNIAGGTGADRFEIEGGTIGGNVTGGAEADTFNFRGGTITCNVDGGAGNDTITLSGGNVTLNVEGGSGNDTFTLSGGTVGRDIDGGTGNDTITISGGMVTGSINGSTSDDTFTLSGGMVTGSINGSTGNDTFNLGSGITIGGILDGGSSTDVLRYMGAPAGTAFAARGGLGNDSNITDGGGSVQSFESQVDDPAITSLGAGAWRWLTGSDRARH